MIERPRAARQGLRACRRRLPARRGRPAGRRAGAPRRAGPPRGRQVDDPPPARAGAGHGQIAERRASENAAPLSEASLKQARREIGKEIHGSLTPEQREALETITGPGGISQLVGRAGTGKGVVISAAARAWQLEGYEVIGTAVAGATAQRLRDDAQPRPLLHRRRALQRRREGPDRAGPKERRGHGRGGDGRHRAPRPARRNHR